MKSFTWCDEIITFTVVIYMTMKKAIMAAIVAALNVSDSYKYTHQITPLMQVVVVFKFLYWTRLCNHIYSCNLQCNLECCAIMAAVYVNGIRIRRLIYNIQKLIFLRLQITIVKYFIRLFTGPLAQLY
jgi:hypothetical protein